MCGPHQDRRQLFLNKFDSKIIDRVPTLCLPVWKGEGSSAEKDTEEIDHLCPPGLCHLKDEQLSRQDAAVKSAQPRCLGRDSYWEVEGTSVKGF